MKDNNPENNPNRRWLRYIIIGLIVLLYAYGVQVTKVNLEEPLQPQRQRNVVGLLRELAHPDLFDYNTETRRVTMTMIMPCPEELKGSQVTSEGRLLLLAPNCVSTTQDPMTLTGEGFPANADGVVFWYPLGSDTARRVTAFKADGEGNFSATFTMPDVRPSEEVQRLEIVEVVDRTISGMSDTTRLTLDRILETILMAFMASSVGTLLAIPISFLAARNLMMDVKSPLAALMAGLILAPFGAWIGGTAASWLVQAATAVSGQTIIGVVALLVVLALIWFIFRAQAAGSVSGAAGTGTTAVLVLLLFLALALLARVGFVSGQWLDARLGILGFLGNFIYVMSDMLLVLLPAIVGFAGALVALSLGSRWGQSTVSRMSDTTARPFTAVLTAIGVAMLIFGLLYAANWICLFGICQRWPQTGSGLWTRLLIPALAGGVLAALASLRREPKRPFPIGSIIYTLTRGTLNGLRSIEPILMGFVFVVWLGIGPFAGMVVLALHSIADLGKLFSEQVENIAEGPLEAVTSTGANRIQTIVYAVIPQIVPHFIAFAFYRWDINVRMSTIIGFVGGGGIGLVLQRATNLTQYRQASVMVIAIALVVIILDYISARIRSRII